MSPGPTRSMECILEDRAEEGQDDPERAWSYCRAQGAQSLSECFEVHGASSLHPEGDGSGPADTDLQMEILIEKEATAYSERAWKTGWKNRGCSMGQESPEGMPLWPFPFRSNAIV